METTQPEALRLADESELLSREGAMIHCCSSYEICEILKKDAAELRRQHALLNTPELLSFRDGVVLEAAHQRERWSSIKDGEKSALDWFQLVISLSTRAAEHHKEAERLTHLLPTAGLQSSNLKQQIDYHREKAVHHTITCAAACANWHAAVLGLTNMRPGVDPAVVAAAGGVA